MQGLPEGGVAHDDGVNHAKLIEGELILAQDAHFLWLGDGTFSGIEVPGQDLHEGGLAGAIGPGNGITAARHERAGDVFEEDPGAEAHRDVIHREYNLSIVAWIRHSRAPPSPARCAHGCPRRSPFDTVPIHAAIKIFIFDGERTCRSRRNCSTSWFVRCAKRR